MRVILTMTVVLVMVMVVVVVVGVMIPRYLKVVKAGQWSRNSLVNVPSIIVAPLFLLVLSLMAIHCNHPSYLRTAQLFKVSYSCTISKNWVLNERIYPNIAMSFSIVLRCVMLMMRRGGWRREGVPWPEPC